MGLPQSSKSGEPLLLSSSSPVSSPPLFCLVATLIIVRSWLRGNDGIFAACLLIPGLTAFSKDEESRCYYRYYCSFGPCGVVGSCLKRKKKTKSAQIVNGENDQQGERERQKDKVELQHSTNVYTWTCLFLLVRHIYIYI